MPEVMDLNTGNVLVFDKNLTPKQAVVAAQNYHHMQATGEVLTFEEAEERFPAVESSLCYSCGDYSTFKDGTCLRKIRVPGRKYLLSTRPKK
jgi:hypothetical protein